MKKVVIPKNVADWIEVCKTQNYGIAECLSNAIEYKMPDDVINWFGDDHKDNLEKELLVARAYLDGYEVEKEKLYTVEIPNPNETNLHLVRFRSQDKRCLFLTSREQLYLSLQCITAFTENEIFQGGFGWAWDAGFAKEVTDEQN